MKKICLIIIMFFSLNIVTSFAYSEPPRNICHYFDSNRYPHWTDSPFTSRVDLIIDMAPEKPDTKPDEDVAFGGELYFLQARGSIKPGAKCHPVNGGCADITFTVGVYNYAGHVCNGVMDLRSDSASMRKVILKPYTM